MTEKEARELLAKVGQEQLLKYYDELTAEEQAALLKQISEIDFTLVNHIDGSAEADKGVITPVTEACGAEQIAARKEEYDKIGIESLKKHEVGALLLAGGMGTRLGSDKPKGMYNIGITKDVYIFERLIANLMDVVKACGEWVPLYIMTSEKNDKDTREFFAEKNYFGYNPEFVDFFVQEMAPACDFNGKIYLEEKGRIATSPNGNGGWYISFVKAGLDKKAREVGVKYINVFAVDNVCQRMADPTFVGAMLADGYRSAAKVVVKAQPEEKVGCLCLEDGKPSIVEYYELTKEMAYQQNEDGSLAYRHGVILNYLFNMDDLDKNLNENLVLHVVKKKIPYVNEAGEIVKPETENGYKFETLVLDMVKQMDNCLPYEVVREREFAPIKNKTGVDSVDSARELLKLNGVEL